MILLTKVPGNPKKLPGCPQEAKKNHGRNPYNIFVAILENPCLYKFILSLTDLCKSQQSAGRQFPYHKPTNKDLTYNCCYRDYN